MKSYSLDLRKKIIEAYEKRDRSQRELARSFGVARSFIQKLLKRYRETGSYAPKTRRVQTPPKLNQEQLEVLAKIVDNKNDATLSEIQEKLAQQTGVLIGISTVFRMLKKLNLSLKKKRYQRQKKKGKKS
jgi:putative transposase